MTKRVCDIVIALTSFMILILPCILIWLGVKLTSSGPGLYWSKRVGRKDTYFMMPKFRSMRVEAPELATDKLLFPKKYITPIGSFLRNTSLDELPQFLSVLFGDMSVVGPRPALHNQHDLIRKRKDLGIDILRPGITGLAQVNGRDEIGLTRKVYLDYQYLKYQSLLLDFKIIIKTLLLVKK